MGNGKYFKLFFEPFDVVEIKVNASFWTLFSTWECAKKLYLTATAEKNNQTIMEFGPYKSDQKIIAVHFAEYNYTSILSSDSADEQIISLMIWPDIYDRRSDHPVFPDIKKNEFPFIQRFEGNSDLFGESDYPFYYNYDSSPCYIIPYLLAVFAGCYFLVLLYSDFNFLKNSLLTNCIARMIIRLSGQDPNKIINQN